MLALEQKQDLRVRLPIFEGPLDLLLYLIKKDELNIYDIPIEHITKEYLQYLELMKMLNLDMAGEFLVMAATLLYLKSRTLLPVDQQPPEEDAEEDDPRWELIRQLVEYKKFKDVAFELQRLEGFREHIFVRTPPEPKLEIPGSVSVSEVGIFDLLTAFQRALERVDKPEDLQEIFEDRHTVSDKIQFLTERFKLTERSRFIELFSENASRTEIVVTFLALLELIRLKRLQVLQSERFGEIEIVRVPEPSIMPPSFVEE